MRSVQYGDRSTRDGVASTLGNNIHSVSSNRKLCSVLSSCIYFEHEHTCDSFLSCLNFGALCSVWLNVVRYFCRWHLFLRIEQKWQPIRITTTPLQTWKKCHSTTTNEKKNAKQFSNKSITNKWFTYKWSTLVKLKLHFFGCICSTCIFYRDVQLATQKNWFFFFARVHFKTHRISKYTAWINSQCFISMI